MASDERLAKLAQTGDSEAIALIYRRYEQDLYRFCMGILGEPQDAQDALQNTMLKILRALPGEQREIRLRPWLYRIAHNEAVEVRRRRRPSSPLEAVEERGTETTLDEDLERQEDLKRLFADLGQLPQRQRAILVMRELNGLEFGEIGAALDTSAGAVRQALYEARRGLEEMSAGRAMACEAVAVALSDGDRRWARRRDVRAHLRDCEDCRRFGAEIRGRRRTLAAIAPVPPLAVAALAKSVLAGSGGGVAGAGGSAGVAATAGGAAVQSILASGLAKPLATLLAVVAVGAAADRSGLVDPGHESRSAYPVTTSEAASGGSAGTAAEGSALSMHRVRGRAAVSHSGRRVNAQPLADLAPTPTRSNVPAVLPTVGDDARSDLPIDSSSAATDGAGKGSAPGHVKLEKETPAGKGHEASEGEGNSEKQSGEARPEHPAHPPHPENSSRPERAPKSEAQAPEHPPHPETGSEKKSGAPTTDEEPPAALTTTP